MKISCVLFTCALLFCDVIFCNDDLDAYVSSLAELNTNFFGTYTEFETTVTESEGAAWEPEFFPSSIKMWESEDGRFLKRYSLEKYLVKRAARRTNEI